MTPWGKHRKIAKAAQIEARNWDAVEEFLDADETPIDYAGTHVVSVSGKEPGHTYVTDRHLILTAPRIDKALVFPWDAVSVEPRQIEKGRMTGRVFGMILTVGGSRYVVEALPLTEPLFERLWPEIQSRAGMMTTPEKRENVRKAIALMTAWNDPDVETDLMAELMVIYEDEGALD